MDAREGGEATSRRKNEGIQREARWDAEVHQCRGWGGIERSRKRRWVA